MPVSNIFARASQTNSTLDGGGHGYRKIEGNQLVQHFVTLGGGGYSLIFPIQGCAAGQGMFFGLSALNRVCDFVRVCPKQGI